MFAPPSPEQFVDSVLADGEVVARHGTAEDYNYLPGANHIMRRAERIYGKKCLPPVIEALNSNAVNNPATRVLIGSLLRLAPGRQRIYEEKLSQIVPGWQTFLGPNPHVAREPGFREVSEQVSRRTLKLSPAMINGLINTTKSQRVDVAIAGLRAFQHVGAPEFFEQCRTLWSAEDERVRVAAVLSAARLSVLDPNANDAVAHLALDKDLPLPERVAAFDAVILSSRGSGRDFLAELVNERESILFKELALLNSVLDAARPDLTEGLEAGLRDLVSSDLSDETLRRIARSSSFTDRLLKPVRDEVRSRLPRERGRFGLLVHRNSSATAAFVGHVGIFVDEETVVHCTTGHDPHAVRSDSFSDWRDGMECWGIREDDDHPGIDLLRAVNLALEIKSWRTEYDGTHNNQKGRWFKGWFCAPSYWEADCVGFTEHCYEEAGGNPTPNEFEQGPGWPLTPREQRDHMRKLLDC